MTTSKIAQEIVDAFLNHKAKKSTNYHTDGENLWCYGSCVAVHLESDEPGYHFIGVTTAGYNTNTTLRFLNLIPGLNVHVKNKQMFLNDRPWDGSWNIDSYKIVKPPLEVAFDILLKD